MSKYDQFATVMKDEDLLVAALRDLGHVVEVFQEGTRMRGYWRDAYVAEPVHIVIRARTLKGDYVSDIGFTRLPDGTYRAHINDMDRQYGHAWLGRVQQKYKERATIQMALKQGLYLPRPTGNSNRAWRASEAAVRHALRLTRISKYDSFETTLTEEGPLAAALKALGYGRGARRGRAAMRFSGG